MSKAKENLLKIFDQYMDDDDSLSMVTFARQTCTIFEPQCIGGNRQALRRKAADACVASGTTSFYDALIASVGMISKAPSDAQRKWIIALTDGEDTTSQHSLEY